MVVGLGEEITGKSELGGFLFRWSAAIEEAGSVVWWQVVPG